MALMVIKGLLCLKKVLTVNNMAEDLVTVEQLQTETLSIKTELSDARNIIRI